MLVSVPAQASNASTQMVVAVFEIQNSDRSLPDSERDKLTDYLIAKLVAAGLVIVPRTEIADVLRETKAKSYDDCYDESCQIEVGKEVAANKIISTKVINLGSKCSVACTAFDLLTATSEHATNQESDCDLDSLTRALDRTALNIVAKLRGEPPPFPEPPVASVETVRSDPGFPVTSLLLGLTGLAGGVVGSVFLAQAESHASNANDPGFVGGQAEIDEAERDRLIGWIGVGTGSATLLAGVIVYLIQDSSPDPDRQRLSLMPSVAPDRAQVSMQVEF